MHEEAQKEFKTKVMQKEEERNESGFEEIQKQDVAANAKPDDKENVKPAASDH